MTKFQLTRCPDCDGRGHVPVYDEIGRELGMFRCPTCRKSPKVGYIMERIEEEDPVVIDSRKKRHYLEK